MTIFFSKSILWGQLASRFSLSCQGELAFHRSLSTATNKIFQLPTCSSSQPIVTSWSTGQFQHLQLMQQFRLKHGHKKKGSFYERIKKTASGIYVARHAHYRHKRYNKSSNQLKRLRGVFVLPQFLQRKLRKAGF